MSRLAQGIVLWTVAIAVAFATYDDTVLSFVRPTMRWPLYATSVLLAAVAAVLILLEPPNRVDVASPAQERARDDARRDALESVSDGPTAPASVTRDAPGGSGAGRHSVDGPAHHGRGNEQGHGHGHVDGHENERDQGHEKEHDHGRGHGHGHDEAKGHAHGRVTRIGWLFVVPFTVLPLTVAGPLGAYSAQRDSGVVATPPSDPAYPALPAGNPVPLTMMEFSERAAFDSANSLTGRRVELTGFVSKTPKGAGWALTRMAIMCCAADAITVKVLPVGARALPPNTWVKAVGTWVPSTATGEQRAQELPSFKVESLTQIPRPAEPYE